MASSDPLIPGANHFISLATARNMTTKCRTEKQNVIKTEFQNDNIIFTCETFNREAFDTLLSQANCAGIRIYSGMDEHFKIRVIAVGVNSNNEDMVANDN